MTTATKTRSAGIDAVRLLGIVGVIFGHVYTGARTHEFFYAWNVPLFFFMTGYMWTHGRSLRDEFTKRGRTLGLPYLGWLVVISALVIVGGLFSGGVHLGMLFGAVQGGAHAQGMFGTFWFISTLFFVALLYRLLDRVPRPVVWAIAAVGLAAGYLFGPWLAATPLAIGSALPCLIFVVVGTAARDLERRVPTLATWPVGAALVVVPLVVIAFIQPTPVDIKQGHFGAPILGVLLACAISYGLVIIGKAIRFPQQSGAIVTQLALVGIAVVLFHPYVIAETRGVLGLPRFLVFLSAVIIPWVVALLLHRTRVSPVLIGAPQRTRQPALTRV